jgi:glucokinase
MDMTRLVADIGGTNVRFAVAGPDAVPVREHAVRTAAYPGVVEAARAYLAAENVAVDEAVFAGAGPVEEERIRLTNSPWTFSVEETRRALGLRRLVVINDFVAQALAIPRLGEGDRTRFGGGEPVPARAIGVIGPGTGLGVAGLLPTAGGWQPLPSEGGHVSFAPHDDVEVEVLRVLRRRFDGEVSNERLLTGPGLVNVATALAELAGEDLEPLRPEEVTARARAGSCRFCVEAVRRFSAVLGSAAGDLALTLLARGGVFVAGGVPVRLGQLFDRELFRARFEAKGRFRDYLRAIPTYLVTRIDTGLLGAAAFRFAT